MSAQSLSGVSGSAHAAGYETLMVPSAAMGRDIPVAFMGGGPHMVVLLDAFDANPDVSNWVTAGNAMNTLAGKGISVAAPAGGAFSMYTDWEQDGSKQWDTFLSSELPDWLAANKGMAPGGNAAVGAGQGGYGSMALATFHPDRYGYAGSMSGFLYPSETTVNGAIIAGFQNFAGIDLYGMWGAPQLGRWKWHDPWVHAELLAANNIRVWVFSPTARGPAIPPQCSTPARPQVPPDTSISSTATSAATTGTSTFPAAGTTAGGRGRGSCPRCRATSPAPSADTPPATLRRRDAVRPAGTVKGCSRRCDGLRFLAVHRNRLPRVGSGIA